LKIKSKLAYAYWFCHAFICNTYIGWHNSRLENSRRLWTAHRIDGGGVVPLGKLNQSKAIDKVAQWGSVVFVDTEVAVIMYRDKN
jgi:hypothetical protein